LWKELLRLGNGGAIDNAINPDEESSSSSSSSGDEGEETDSESVAGPTREFPPRDGCSVAKSWTPHSWLLLNDHTTKVREGTLVEVTGRKTPARVAQVGAWCRSTSTGRARNEAIVWIAKAKLFLVVPFAQLRVLAGRREVACPRFSSISSVSSFSLSC
jgi:hypothetical protein